MIPDRKRRMRAGAVAATAALLGFGAGAAQADEAAAREIVRKMTDYLAAAETLSFDFDTSLQVVTEDGQRLDIASSGSMAVARPDKLRAIRKGGFAEVQAVFDGKTLSVLNASANTFGQAEAAGSIDDLITLLRDTYQRPLPAADLLASDIGAGMLAEVSDVKDLGSGVIRGEECDHLAFRAPEVDFQLWVAQGDVPHPCRLTITSTTVAGNPGYTIEFSAWGAGAAAADFAFAAPEGATEVDLMAVPDLDDVAGIFMVKGAN